MIPCSSPLDVLPVPLSKLRVNIHIFIEGDRRDENDPRMMTMLKSRLVARRLLARYGQSAKH